MRKSWLFSRLGVVSHLLAALIPFSWFPIFGGSFGGFAVFFLSIFLGLLPDIDTHASHIGKIFPFISQPIERRFGHRTITHSLLAVVVIGAFTRFFYADDWGVLTSAYLSHLLLDMVIGAGIPLFFPAHLHFYFLRMKGGGAAEAIVTGMLAVVVLLPFTFPSVAQSASNIIPEPTPIVTPLPTSTPQPANFEIRIAHIYDIDSEILVAVGDVVERGQLLASLEIYRELEREIQAEDTPTPTITPSPLPLVSPAPLPTPYPTVDALYLAELENNRNLAQAIYQRTIATGTPDPNKQQSIPNYNLAIAEKVACMSGYNKSDWQYAQCERDLHILEATAVSLIATPVPIDPIDADIAYFRYQQANIAYQQAIAQLTPHPTASPTSTHTPTITPSPTTSPTLPPILPTATPHPQADKYTIYSQISGEIAAINLVSVDGNSVTVVIIVLVDEDDPLFVNPFEVRESVVSVEGRVAAEVVRVVEYTRNRSSDHSRRMLWTGSE